MEKHSKGMPLKKGQLVKVSGYKDYPENSIFEVGADVEWNSDYKIWGSVWLVNQYPPLFTHKGGIEVIS